MCSASYSGADCSLSVCSPSCNNGGQCINGVCNCTSGWQDSSCSTPVTPGVCPISCGVGVCSPSSNFSCVCPSGSSGVQCQILSCPSDCSGLFCHLQLLICFIIFHNAGNGNCVFSSGVPTCNCSSQFTGPTCASAQCTPRFFGFHCLSLFAELKHSSCANGGTCVASGGSVACQCGSDFTGSQCQVPVPRSGVVLSSGAIAGIAVGAVVAGVLLAVAIALILKVWLLVFSL